MQVKVTVRSKEENILLETEKGTNLLQFLQANNIPIASPCAGRGNCGKCRVKLNRVDKELSATELNFLTAEEVEKGYRLACYTVIEEDMEIEVPGEEEIEVLTGAMKFNIDFDPQLQINNCQGDKENNKVFGLAVDLGTTTVAVYLMNLLTGEEVAVDSFANPQKKYGADVLRRIDYAHRGKKELEELQDIVVRQLNSSIEQLALQNNIEIYDIYYVTVVANTVMTHFLTGTDPYDLARPPFRPAFTNSLRLSPAELNIQINPRGIIHILPSVSAYLGSDIIAGLLVTDFSSDKWNLLLDIGTNGEIVLGNQQKILACSAAAGPAFEGGSITFGVAGLPGAISGFSIDRDWQFNYKTIKGQKPIGICGSGLIDIIAELLDHKIISRTGLIREDIGKDLIKIRDYKNMKAIEIVDEESTAIDGSILLTQKDIREVQLAKGAIAAGINILIKEAGISYEEIANIYLAGGFGSFINPVSACKIGLLPRKMERSIRKIGNAAGLGAKSYLLDKRKRVEAELLAEKIEYLELSLRKDFQTEFIRAMDF